MDKFLIFVRHNNGITCENCWNFRLTNQDRSRLHLSDPARILVPIPTTRTLNHTEESLVCDLCLQAGDRITTKGAS